MQRKHTRRSSHAPQEAARPRKGQRSAPAPETAVLQCLRRAGRPLRLDEVTESLGPVAGADAATQLAQLVKRGEVVLNRRGQYCLREQLPGLVIGTVQAQRNGDGWLMPDDASASIYLPSQQMREVIHGDRVAVRIEGPSFRGKPQGAIVEVLERRTKEVVGRLHVEAGVAWLTPDNPRISHRVLVPQAQLGGAESGQIVIVELTQQPGRSAQPVGRVTRLIGEHGAPGMETEIAIHSHGLPFEFPDGALAEARAYGGRIPESAIAGREDLRGIELVTIDGEDARDYDDAVHCERARGGWKVIVAIADVGHYVQPGSALDAEARERGTSVYFPNRVLPMLPEELSNGLCSLVPDEDRLCLCCELRVSDDGRITRSRFFEAVMRSAARLTYREVGEFLERPAAKHAPKIEQLRERLLALHGVYHSFLRERSGRGALELDTPELKLKFDAEGRIAALVEYPRNDAHRLIEECMIAANIAAARYLDRNHVPTLYRVHGMPEEDRLETLRQFLREFGLWLPPAGEVTAQAPARPAAEARRPARRAARLDGGHPFDAAGGLPAGQHRAFRARARALRAFHLADPPLPRSRRAPGHSPGVEGRRPAGTRGVARTIPDARPGLFVPRTARRRGDARRGRVAQVLLHAGSHRRGVRRDRLGRRGLRAVRAARRHAGGRAAARLRAARQDYFARDRSGFRMIGRSSGKAYRLGDRLRVRVVERIARRAARRFRACRRRRRPRGEPRRPRQSGRRR